eukprot:4929375-Prymnesium_polylepis.1
MSIGVSAIPVRRPSSSANVPAFSESMPASINGVLESMSASGTSSLAAPSTIDRMALAAGPSDCAASSIWRTSAARDGVPSACRRSSSSATTDTGSRWGCRTLLPKARSSARDGV